jgi:hypothetical protein
VVFLFVKANFASGGVRVESVVMRGSWTVASLALALGCSSTVALDAGVGGDAAGGSGGGGAQGGGSSGGAGGGVPAVCPTAPPSPVVELALTSGATLALLEDGTVWCWGRCGGDDEPPSLEPRPLEGIAGATRLRAEGAAACALIADGTVRCWGDPFVAVGTEVADGVFQPAISGVIQIGVANELACAVDAGGRLWCWGREQWFAESPNDEHIVVPEEVTALPATDWLEMAWHNVCVHVVDQGTGAHAWHCLHGGFVGHFFLPMESTDFSTAQGDSCAVYADGTTECWCEGSECLAPMSGVAQIAIGSGPLRCLLRQDATVGCQLTEYVDVNDDLPGLLPARVVESGGHHACAIEQGGSVRCWGDNDHGQLGDGTLDDEVDPWPTLDPLVASCVVWPTP